MTTAICGSCGLQRPIVLFPKAPGGEREGDCQLCKDTKPRSSYRRAAVTKMATPSWVNRSELSRTYAEARLLTLITRAPHHVDHVFPLRGKQAWGLHVPWNLDVVPALSNVLKKNMTPARAYSSALRSETLSIGGQRADIAGDRFGRWVAVSYVGYLKKQSWWMCRCDCGVEKMVSLSLLRRGASKSCGCLQSEVAREVARRQGIKNRTHGDSGKKLYSIWVGMMRRCYNEKHVSFRHYGGRGIGVCSAWHDYRKFADDVGAIPFDGAELDRVDNDGDYQPSNWRWASRSQQLNNTRVNRNLTFGGRTQSATEWCRELGLNRNSLQGRLRLGWSDEAALSKPFRKKEDVSRPL